MMLLDCPQLMLERRSLNTRQPVPAKLALDETVVEIRSE